MDKLPRARLRLRFERLGLAETITHLEQIKVFRAMVVSAELPYFPAKHGGAMAPKMAFGPALPTGYKSRCEYADLYLIEPVREAEAFEKLSAVCTEAFSLLSVKSVPVHFPSIEASVQAVRYSVAGDFSDIIPDALNIFMSAQTVQYARKNTAVEEIINARSQVVSGVYDGQTGTLQLLLKPEPGKALKPNEAVSAICGTEIAVSKVIKEALVWFDAAGTPREL